MHLAGQINHTVIFNKEYDINYAELDDGNTYSKIKWNGLGQHSEKGLPVLPVKYLRLIIPANNTAIAVEIKKMNTENIKIDFPIAPGQEAVPTSIYFTPGKFISCNEQVYKSNKPYPKNRVKIVDEIVSRGNKIVTLAIYPLKYKPDKKEILFANEISIALHLKDDNKDKKVAKVRKDKQYIKRLKQKVANVSDVDKYNVYTITSDTISSTKSFKLSGIVPMCEYVIITPSALQSSFFNFMSWKKLKGIDVALVTTEEIYANYSGDLISGIYDNAGKVRQFLNDCFDNGTTYALLAGDYNYVPIRKCHYLNNTTNENYIIPTDLYFSDFDGDWNVDNDTYYGEPDDNIDNGHELIVGRLLCTSASEIDNWVNKVICYENNPGNGDFSYLSKLFFTQADQLQRDNQAN